MATLWLLAIRTSFAGSQQGQHPDRTICLPSESRWVRIRTGGGPAAHALLGRGRPAVLLRVI